MRVIFAHILFVSITLISCKNNTIAAKLYDNCGGQDSCTRLVKDVTNFKWDKVYIFTVGASLEDIEKTLGIPYKQWQDIGERIIFVDKSRIVYHEEYFPYPEHIDKGRTFFQLTKAPYIGQYNAATFAVEKKENENGEWFYVVIPNQ